MSEFYEGQKVWVKQGATWGYASAYVEPVENDGAEATVVQAHPDTDRDIRVICNGDDEEVYVNVAFVSPLNDEKKSEGTPELDGVWVAYAGATFTVHEDELNALRWAVRRGGDVEKVAYGQEVDL